MIFSGVKKKKNLKDNNVSFLFYAKFTKQHSFVNDFYCILQKLNVTFFFIDRLYI